MEMLQLRYFFDTAKTGSFAKTAEHYAVPATSVSAAVKRLEKELGCQLFDRSCNRIVLNENGRKLQQSLGVVFQELDRTVCSLSDVNTDTRQIKLLVRAMRGEIADHIIEYTAMHPHIKFKTCFDFGESNYENYDIIIDEDAELYPGYDRFPYCHTQITVRAASTHPLCGQKLRMQQLRNEPFIAIGEHNCLHRLLLRVCRQAGFTPTFSALTNDLTCLRKFAQAGIGIYLSREYPRADHPANTEILHVSDFDETQTICIYCRQASAYGNVAHFLDFLKSKTM